MSKKGVQTNTLKQIKMSIKQHFDISVTNDDDDQLYHINLTYDRDPRWQYYPC